MQIAYLCEFIELMNCMSFNKAAEKLYISQPALSNHIAELEKEFGTTLVTRDRPIKPTAAGVSLYGDACKIVEIYDAARRRCHDLEHSNARGNLTIKSPHSTSIERKRFMSIVAAFKNEYPFIEVNLVSGSNKYLVEELRNGGIDCGFAPESIKDDLQNDDSAAFEFIPTATEPLGLWMDPRNPLASQTGLTVGQLNRCHYPLPSGAQYKELVDPVVALFEHHGVSPQYRYVLASTFDEFMFGMQPGDVLLGVESSARVTSGALDDKVFVPFEPTIPNKNCIVIRTDSSNPALTLFCDYVIRKLAEQESERTSEAFED